MKIIVDAMGGDNAPGAIVRGALEAKPHPRPGDPFWWGGRRRSCGLWRPAAKKSLPAGVWRSKGATEVVGDRR